MADATADISPISVVELSRLLLLHRGRFLRKHAVEFAVAHTCEHPVILDVLLAEFAAPRLYRVIGTMSDITKMPQIAHTFSAIGDQLLLIDTTANELVWSLANFPPKQARRLIDDALSRVLPGKTGDKELARRKAWIRKEIIRRLDAV